VFAIAGGLWVFTTAIPIAIFSNPGSQASTEPNSAHGSSLTSHIDPLIPGAPKFSISYPSSIGLPVVQAEIGNPGHIDADNNLTNVEFYNLGAKRDPGFADDGADLVLSFYVAPLKSGQSFQSFADSAISPSDKEKSSFPIIVDGTSGLAMKTSSHDPVTYYFVPASEGGPIYCFMVSQKIQSNVNKEEDKVAAINVSLKLENSIVSSVKFDK
jgi:hypothetical protein